MAHSAESTHWYTRKGEPAYTVKAKDGSDRPTNLRDARKLLLVPSVTTIIRCAAAPGLERWKQDQVLHAALTLPRGDTEPEAEWISRVWTDSGETARKAAERGTAIHAAIQGYYETGYFERELKEHVIGAVDVVAKWGGGLWVAETAFACQMGFGGKVDLSSPGSVLDFKTKEFDKGADLKTWDEQAMQLAAYRFGLGIETARCAICYVSVSVPGLAKLIEIPEADLQKGWRMFLALLNFWQARTGYQSSWMPEKVAA